MSTPRSAWSPTTRTSSADVSRFASDVEYYLTLNPRQLPSRYLYDALGSALFEAICELPWYAITRAERRLIEAHGRAILRHAEPLSRLVELGPGSGEKLVALVRSGGRRAGALDIHLVDVSPAALSLAGRTLSTLDDVRIVDHTATYETGLAEVAAEPIESGRTLVLFLGSNIGNFDPPGADAFLRTIRSALSRHDLVLLGADLVKPEPVLRAAYDDPLGVTAAFNRNLLVRINRELGGTFDLDGFAHEAVWNEAESRVEMHLVCTRAQTVSIAVPGLVLEFDRGDAIWTESSYKYRPDVLARVIERAGFTLVAQWLDASDGFALTLVRAS